MNCCIRYIRPNKYSITHESPNFPSKSLLSVTARDSFSSLCFTHPFPCSYSHLPPDLSSHRRVLPSRCSSDFRLASALAPTPTAMTRLLSFSYLVCSLYLLLLLFFTSRSIHISYEYDKALLVSFDLFLFDVCFSNFHFRFAVFSSSIWCLSFLNFCLLFDSSLLSQLFCFLPLSRPLFFIQVLVQLIYTS